ncbi:hypothetical protein QQF64_017690 [Cirrhinus molitorella]|uniref:Uncharacterized protein n=1 Tax=Cirrhinus molitorella TaxID=172907 RepID=A0ABR3LJD0_9TELE
MCENNTHECICAAEASTNRELRQGLDIPPTPSHVSHRCCDWNARCDAEELLVMSRTLPHRQHTTSSLSQRAAAFLTEEHKRLKDQELLSEEQRL